MEELAQLDPKALIVLGGDFNQLEEGAVVERTGLIPMIKNPTRGTNILDRLFVSEPCYTTIKILDSALKTDHKAIIATTHDRPTVISRNKRSVRVAFRRRSPQQHAALLWGLESVDLSGSLPPLTHKTRGINSIARQHRGWTKSILLRQ